MAVNINKVHNRMLASGQKLEEKQNILRAESILEAVKKKKMEIGIATEKLARYGYKLEKDSKSKEYILKPITPSSQPELIPSQPSSEPTQ